jgi:hypothetical protein
MKKLRINNRGSKEIKMNKLLAVVALSILVVSPAIADHDDFRHRGEYERHGGGGDGWKWLGGAIIGGIIVDQIDRDRYAPPPVYSQYPEYSAPPPMRRVLRCTNYISTDYYGNQTAQRYCHYELIPAY